MGQQSQQSPHQPTGAGLFGTQQAQPSQGGGLFSSFGQKQAQAQAQQGNLLGQFGLNKAPSILSVPSLQSKVDIWPMSSS